MRAARIPGAWVLVTSLTLRITGAAPRPGAAAGEVLTADQAIRGAMEASPEVVAAAQAIQVGQASVQVAKVYPYNPLFQYEYLAPAREPDGTRVGAFRNYLLYQTVELAGKQRRRRARAQAELERSRWSLRRAELAVESQVLRAYLQAQYLSMVRDLMDDRVALAATLAGMVHRRVEAGLATPADEALARMDRMTMELSGQAARQAEENARGELLRASGRDPRTPVRVDGTLHDWMFRELDSLVPEEGAAPTHVTTRITDLVWARPDLNLARAEVRVATENMALLRANRVPDLMIGPQLEQDPSGARTAGVKAAVELPVFNRRSAPVRQARADATGKERTLQALERMAVREATQALLRYERARRLVEDLARLDRPGPADARRALEDGFRAGQTDLLKVYSGNERELTWRRASLDALQELAQAAVQVVQVTGLPRDAVFTRRKESP